MNATPSDLICSICGEIVTIYRQSLKQRPYYHIKDMWCPICKDVTKFIEIKDKDLAYSKLLYSQDRNEIQELAFKLLSDRKKSKDEKMFGRNR